MKIVILVRILWTAGAPKVAIEEAKSLMKLGHNVDLVFLRKTKSGDIYLPLLTDTHWEVISEGRPGLGTALYNFATGLFAPDRKGDGRLDYNLIRSFPSYIMKRNPDLIICHDQWAGLAGYYAFKKFGVKYVTIIHESVSKYDLPLLGRVANYFEQRTLKYSNKIFAINDKISDSVKQVYGLRSIVNYHGIDSTHSIDYSKKKSLILASSTWDSNRASDVYLNVIRELDDRYKLVLAGRWRSNALKDIYIDMIHQYGLENRVKLLDDLTEQELNQLYIDSKFIIRFGFKEHGNPHAIIDSLSHRTVPILNSELGIAKLIKEYEAGIIVEPSDWRAIIKSIEIADDLDSYLKFQNNIDRLCSKYTWEKHCKLIIDCYNTTANHGPRHQGHKKMLYRFRQKARQV